MIIPMAFTPNYIAHLAGTDVFNGMMAWGTKYPAPVKPAYPVQTVLLKVTLGTEINKEKERSYENKYFQRSWKYGNMRKWEKNIVKGIQNHYVVKQIKWL